MKKACSFSFFILLSCLLGSCGNKGGYKYWELSKFKMDKTALTDNEPVKLLYSSRGPDYNQDLEYFIHIIAVSQKTGDTVNILTTADNGFKDDDRNKIFTFFSEDSPITKLTVDSTKMSEIDKVARLPKHDAFADNTYPTVIGMIGTSTPGEIGK